MDYETIALKDVIQEFGKKKANSVLSNFLCPLNKDVEDFIHTKAIAFENAGMAKTYLITAQNNNTNYGICAIYSITTKSLSIDKNMDNKSRKQAFGTKYAIGNPVNAILIGQLSKNYYNDNNKYISGEIIMSLIMEHIKEMDTLVPSVSVYVECEDIPQLRNFYEQYGFTYFSTNSDGLLQYIIPTRKFIAPEYINMFKRKTKKTVKAKQTSI